MTVPLSISFLFYYKRSRFFNRSVSFFHWVLMIWITSSGFMFSSCSSSTSWGLSSFFDSPPFKGFILVLSFFLSAFNFYSSVFINSLTWSIFLWSRIWRFLVFISTCLKYPIFNFSIGFPSKFISIKKFKFFNFIKLSVSDNLLFEINNFSSFMRF